MILGPASIELWCRNFMRQAFVKAQRMDDDLKKEVRDFWNEASCLERLLLDASDKVGYPAQMEKRYSLKPFTGSFACFDFSRDLDMLEIGAGLGADH
jgi:hypothetical protein